MPVAGVGAQPAGQGEDAILVTRAMTAVLAATGASGRLAVAVSGGSDSMALLHLAARALPARDGSLLAVTVNHRLRPEAAAEAAFVAGVCADLGVTHDILAWQHGPTVAGNLMQVAREARYGLMADWAARRGIDRVALAHTADDQAETFLMGLARAAGLDGLSGMRHSFVVDGVTFVRPFLGMTRAGLRGFLRRHGHSWVDDPSNDNDRFARVRARRAMVALKPLGITASRLCEVIDHLAMARAVVRHAVGQAAGALVSEAAGSLRFDGAPFFDLDPEVQRRLLIAMVLWISTAPHPPRESKVKALVAALMQRKDATLGGVRFRWDAGVCTVFRELRACGGAVPAGRLWDGRWQVSGRSGEVRALGPEGLRQCPDWRATGLSRQRLEVTPGLWQGQTLIAAPCAGLGAETATLTASFSLFLLSH